MRFVPKQVFFYWGGSVLPYLRYMALYSFRKYNPDWRMVLYVPKDLTTTQSWATFENKEGLDTEDYMDRLENLGVHVAPFDMEAIGFSNDLPEVIKSDIIRLYLLSTVGGLWSDSDILYFRPLTAVLRETNHTAFFCYRRGGPTQDPTPANGPPYHSIGFLAGAPGNRHYTKLFELARNYINLTQYQSVGSPFYKTVIDMEASDVFNFDINLVYPSRAVPGMYSNAEYYATQIRKETIGWHWYAGHPDAGHLQNVVTEKTYHQFDNVFCWAIGKILRNEEI